MHLFSAAWRGLPCHRAEGLGASGVLHVATLTLLATLPASPPPAAGLILTQVSADDLAAPDADRAETGDGAASGAIAGADAAGDETVRVDGLELEIAHIRRQRDVLFPFVTRPLNFLDEVRAKFDVPPGTLVNPFGREKPASTLPPLSMSDREVDRLVDRAWSRRERWKNFSEIAALLLAYDPDGATAALVRRHLDRNLLQPYFETPTGRRDPRFWVTLGLAADHNDFVDFAGAFVRRFPSSRTTSELLFMLDEYAQASRDAMLLLLGTDVGRLLEATRAADSDAFALAESLHYQYRAWAREAGLDRPEAVRDRFDDVRIDILTTIVESSPEGYGTADARFLIGRIYWDRGDVPAALGWWRQLAPDGRGAYLDARTAIAEALASTARSPVVAISSILGAEYRRWLTLSAERLAEFGYELDTF